MSLRPLSAAALRVAAERARDYPPGHAHYWGSLPLFPWNSLAAARLLQDRPELSPYG